MAQKNTVDQSTQMRRYSEQAGPLQSAKLGDRVRFVPTNLNDKKIYRIWTRVLAYGSLFLVLALTAVLFQPQHWVATQAHSDPRLKVVNWLMLGCLALLQLFLLIGTYMSTRSTLRAKNPIPMTPPAGLRVAFITTRAPGEPVSLVETTLKAAKRMRYDTGSVDVWLLDETKSQELIDLCAKLDVHYFSRKDTPAWNSVPQHRRLFRFSDPAASKHDPYFAAKTKHGNLNAWGQHLYDTRYDIVAGVDTDQVPEVNFLERLLGYFNDPDVAYAVGPQVYGNYESGMRGLVTRWAESQASFFQSTIQRAANASDAAMFVGTNYAIRTATLSQLSGYYPCITEDLATGITVHRAKNPLTGNYWRSVYTPDVLALGEGPSYWSHYFSQQWRWAAGAFDTIKKLFTASVRQLPPKVRTHYLLIMLFYPMAALTWLFGMASSLLYLFTGASAIHVAWNQFISLYLMSTVLQLSVYFWNRRDNVSPMLPAGSYGVPGMIITSLTAPVYLSAMLGTMLGRKVSFVVTKKGSTANPDSYKAFATHLKWAGLLVAGVIFGLSHGHTSPAILIWVSLQLAVCLLPFGLGMWVAYPDRKREANDRDDDTATTPLMTMGTEHA